MATTTKSTIHPLNGGNGDDRITGSDAPDAISGGSGADVLLGAGGDDLLKGDAGQDLLDGGAGNDRVEGFSDDDVLVYVAAENAGAHDEYDGGAGADTLRLVLTREEWMRPAVQSDVAAFLAFISGQANPSGQATAGVFAFSAFDLVAGKFERLEVVVDGVALDPIDEAVMAVGDQGEGEEDGSIAGAVLINDAVPDLVRSVEVVAAPAHGNLDFKADGSYVYTPGDFFNSLAAGEKAEETFRYRVTDADLDTGEALVTLTILGTNDGPVVAAEDVTGALAEAIAPAGTLTDSGTIAFEDPDLSDIHSIGPVTASAGALGAFTAAVSTDTTDSGAGGVVTWTYSVDAAAVEYLAAGQSKVESFSFEVLDGNEGVVPRTVDVTITGTNDGPVITNTAAALVGAVQEDQALTASGQLSATDVDDGATQAWSVQGAAAKTYGSIAVDAGSGKWTYTLNNAAQQALAQGEAHDESFTVRVTDDQGAFVDQTVTVTVAGTNDKPVAVADVLVGTEDIPVSFTAAQLLGNDSDVDAGAQLSIASVTSGIGGTAVRNADGSVTFTPDANFNGTASFSYVASDGIAQSDEASVSIDVAAVNDPAAIGSPSPAAVTEDAGVDGAGNLVAAGSIAISDVDSGEAAFVATVVPGAGNLGALQLAAGGSYTYRVSNVLVQPLAQGQTRTDIFTVQSVDGTSKEVNFTVTGVNDVPAVEPEAVIAATNLEEVPYGRDVDATLLTGGNWRSDNPGGLVEVRPGRVYGVTNNSTYMLELERIAGEPSNLYTDINAAAGSWFLLDFDYAARSGYSATSGFDISWRGSHVARLQPTAPTMQDGLFSLWAPTAGNYRLEFKALDRTAAGALLDNISVTQVGGVQEAPDGTTGNIVTGGTLAFSDADLSDRHEVGAVTASGGALGSLTATLATDTTGSGSGGVVEWDYSVAAVALEHLGAGEVKVERFTVDLVDDAGGSTKRTVTVALTGTNDAPTIAAPQPLVASTDFEEAAGGKAAGLNGGVWRTGNAGGWIEVAGGGLYGVTNDASRVIELERAPGDPSNLYTDVSATAGESFRLDFDYAARAGAAYGSDMNVYWNDALVASLTPRAPVMQHLALVLSAPTSGSYRLEFRATQQDSVGGLLDNISLARANVVTEMDAPVGNIGTAGTLAFSDVDLSDVHAVSAAAVGSALGSLTATVAEDGSGGGTIRWNYSVAAAALEFLNADELRVETFDITLEDGHGGLDTQRVEVVATGTNDAPVITNTATARAGTVREDNALVATGQLSVDDVDHGATEAWAVLGSATGTYGSMAVDGTGRWTYTLDNATHQHLAQDESHDETFTIRVADDQGAFVDQAVTVTVSGTNDAAAIGNPTNSSVAEDVGVNGSGNLVATGTISIADADTGQAVLQTIVGAPGGNLGSLVLAAHGAYTYTVANAAVQALAAGQTKTDTFAVRSIDGTSKDVAFAIAGANDHPALVAPPVVVASTNFDEVTPWPSASDLNGDVWATDNGSGQIEVAPGDGLYGLTNDSSHVLELERYAGDPSNLYTNVAAVAGQTFRLDFDFAARFKYVASSEIDVYWGGTLVRHLSPAAPTMEHLALALSAPTEGSYKLEFRASDRNGSGGLLDNINLSNVSAVYEMGTPAGQLQQRGALAFSDQDLADVHGVSTAPVGTVIGSLSASVAADSTGTGGGSVQWQYSVDASALEYLAPGELKMETFEVVLNDRRGGSATQQVQVMLVGNDGPAIGAPAALPVLAATNFEETKYGVEPHASDLAGGIWRTSNPNGVVEVNTGSVYGISNDSSRMLELERSASDPSDLYTDLALQAGEYVRLDLDYAARGGFPGAESAFDVYWGNTLVASLAPTAAAMQPYSIALSAPTTGSYRLEFQARTPNGAGAVLDNIEVSKIDALVEMGTPVGNIGRNGTLAFNDSDPGDFHSVSLAAAGSVLGSMTAVVDQASNVITWNYSVAATALEYLAAGEVKVDAFNLVVDDGHGGLDTQLVEITIVGTAG